MKVTLRIENNNIADINEHFYHEDNSDLSIPISQSPMYHLDINTVAREHERVVEYSTTKYLPGMHTVHLGEYDYDTFNIINVITTSGNVITITRNNNVTFLCYTGTRGRFLETIERLRITDINKVKVYHYTTTGPKDMYPWEDAYTFTVRQHENGNDEPLQYWLKTATPLIEKYRGVGGINQTMRHLISYALDKVEGFDVKSIDPSGYLSIDKYKCGDVAYCIS